MLFDALQRVVEQRSNDETKGSDRGCDGKTAEVAPDAFKANIDSGDGDNDIAMGGSARAGGDAFDDADEDDSQMANGADNDDDDDGEEEDDGDDDGDDGVGEGDGDGDEEEDGSTSDLEREYRHAVKRKDWKFASDNANYIGVRREIFVQS